MITIQDNTDDVASLVYYLADLSINFDKIDNTDKNVLRIPLFEKRAADDERHIGDLTLQNVSMFKVVDEAEIGGGFISHLTLEKNILTVEMCPEENMTRVYFDGEIQIKYNQLHIF